MVKETTMRRIALMLAGSSVLFLGLAGCGNGGGSAPQLQQQKTATITFSTVSSFHPAPLRIIQLSARLPEGVSFKNITTALTGHNDTGSLLGSSYSPATRTLSFIVASPSEPIRFGRFAELLFDISPGFTLSQSSFEAVNNPFPFRELNSGNFNGQTIDLTPYIDVKISVSF